MRFWFGCVAAFVIAVPVGAAPQWGRAVGGAGGDFFYAVAGTASGGATAAGQTRSAGAGGSDASIVAFDSTGAILWQKVYGGGLNEGFYAIAATADSGYILAGYNATSAIGSHDLWVVKTDSAGTIKWQRVFGGTRMDVAESVRQTADGGYVVAGWTASFGAGGYDAWCIALNSNGKLVWQKTIGGAMNDIASAVRQTADGGFLLAGNTRTYGVGSSDAWCIRLDAAGSVLWQRTYGGPGQDGATAVVEDPNGDILLVGTTSSYGSGKADAWLILLDSTGGVLWEKAYGTASNETIHSAGSASGGGWIIAGQTTKAGSSFDEGWCLKVDATGAIAWQYLYTGPTDGDDRLRAVDVLADGGIVVAGYTYTFTKGLADGFVMKLASTGKVCQKLTNVLSEAVMKNTDSTGAPSKASNGDTAVEARFSTAKTVSSSLILTKICN